jgi:hypothetical protein
MLYWICPECGHECSPAIRECPTCTSAAQPPAGNSPVQQPTSVSQPAANHGNPTTDGHLGDSPLGDSQGGISQGLLSLAQNFQSAPSTALLTAAPQRKLLVAGNGAAVAVQEPETVVQPAEPEPSLQLAALDFPALQPVSAPRLEPMKLIPTPVPARNSSPALAPLTAVQAVEFGLQTATLAPVTEVRFQAAASAPFRPLDQSVEPLPSRRRSVAFVRAEVPGAEHSGMAIADLARPVNEPENAGLKPVAADRNGHQRTTSPSDRMSAPLVYQTSQLSLVASELNLAGASLVELLNALTTYTEELNRKAIAAIHASFSQQPVAHLLSAPAEIVTAPAPPATEWIRTQRPKLTAIAPEYAGRGAAIAGPQAPTLAGPSLPPQLINLDQENSRLHRNRKRTTAWPLTLLIGTVVILGAASLLQYMAQDHDTNASAVAAPAQVSRAASLPAAPVVQEHPAARSVEVAGIRIVTGSNRKPQLQFVVINHSANELTGLSIRIAVRSVDGLSGPPLFNVSSPIAVLGANQSKEIRTDLDASIKPASIPDWQSLRTEVLVARQ